jgi:hypothetical protein
LKGFFLCANNVANAAASLPAHHPIRIYLQAAIVIITNCTFTGNKATGSNGGSAIQMNTETTAPAKAVAWDLTGTTFSGVYLHTCILMDVWGGHIY